MALWRSCSTPPTSLLLCRNQLASSRTRGQKKAKKARSTLPLNEDITSAFGGGIGFCRLPQRTAGLRKGRSTLPSSRPKFFLQLMTSSSGIASFTIRQFSRLRRQYLKLIETLPKKQQTQAIGTFATMALNIDYAASSHRDNSDYREGFCFILPFGSFTGGRLRLDSYGVEIDAHPGDLIILRSYLVEHSVTPYEGIRHSIVFFSHNMMFKWAQSQ